ncbi:hypothetical protein B0J17DRAFT_301860 [Rhizoctonia solani]|nr:hypothetical protein B0J17DRAFT_301860 [Rhizoctonia solani]
MILDATSHNTHRLTPCFTGTTFWNAEDGQPGDSNVEHLIAVLDYVRVDSLLPGDSIRKALQWGNNLSRLLGRIPELKTLKMDGWFINTRTWKALEQLDVHGKKEVSDGPKLLRLQNLHLINVVLYDEERLKNLVQTHRIEQLELGAQMCSSPSDTDHEPEDYQPLSAETVNWSQSKAPRFHLVNPAHSHPEFNTCGWERELW